MPVLFLIIVFFFFFAARLLLINPLLNRMDRMMYDIEKLIDLVRHQ